MKQVIASQFEPKPGVVLNYETPPPVPPLWRRVASILHDRDRALCRIAFVFLGLTPGVPRDARAVTVVLAIACFMFVAGSKDEEPLI